MSVLVRVRDFEHQLKRKKIKYNGQTSLIDTVIYKDVECEGSLVNLKTTTRFYVNFPNTTEMLIIVIANPFTWIFCTAKTLTNSTSICQRTAAKSSRTLQKSQLFTKFCTDSSFFFSHISQTSR